MADEIDPYYYARHHESGPGAWCVRGPGGFEMRTNSLTKDQAYVVGKILSGRYADARQMLEFLERVS